MSGPRGGSTMFRRALALIGACAALMVSAWAGGASPGGVGPPPGSSQGSCDVDGVTTSYGTRYRESPGPAAHRVLSVEVGALAPTCQGAQLSVRLTAGGTIVSGGPVAVGGNTATVPLDDFPRAEDVTAVHVELVGGQVPVPEECSQMVFEHVAVGTTGDDVMTGSSQADLLFALGGDDSVRAGNRADCVDGGVGDDTLAGENQADVLLGRAGDDTLDGGTQDDALYGGDGDDVLDGGPGHDRCVGGPGTDRFTGCEEVVQ